MKTKQKIKIVLILIVVTILSYIAFALFPEVKGCLGGILSIGDCEI